HGSRSMKPNAIPSTSRGFRLQAEGWGEAWRLLFHLKVEATRTYKVKPRDRVVRKGKPARTRSARRTSFCTCAPTKHDSLRPRDLRDAAASGNRRRCRTLSLPQRGAATARSGR